MNESEQIQISQETIKAWLETKHSTLWSTWAIDDDKGREKASEWMYGEIMSLVHFTMTQHAHV